MMVAAHHAAMHGTGRVAVRAGPALDGNAELVSEAISHHVVNLDHLRVQRSDLGGGLGNGFLVHAWPSSFHEGATWLLPPI